MNWEEYNKTATKKTEPINSWDTYNATAKKEVKKIIDNPQAEALAKQMAGQVTFKGTPIGSSPAIKRPAPVSKTDIDVIVDEALKNVNKNPFLNSIVVGAISKGINPKQAIKDTIELQQEEGAVMSVLREIQKYALPTPGIIPGEGAMFGAIKKSFPGAKIEVVEPLKLPKTALGEIKPPKTTLIPKIKPQEAITEALPIKTGKVSPQAKQTTTDPLIQEAKKYKSAEEFVKANKGFQKGDIIKLDDNAILFKDWEEGIVPKKEMNKYSDWVVDDIFEDGTLNISTLEDAGKWSSNVNFKSAKITDYGLKKKQSQLTDIWNKAQKTSLGELPKPKAPKVKSEAPKEKITTERTIGTPAVSKRIEAQTIEKGLVESFKDMPDYEKVSRTDQAIKVKEILDTDPDKAIRIALGKELPTNGALPESVLIAVKNNALETGNTDLLVRLATEEGGVAREGSILGQRIKMLDEANPNNAFTNIKRVVNERRSNLEQKTGKKMGQIIKEETGKIKNELNKTKPTKDVWLAFVDEIQC